MAAEVGIAEARGADLDDVRALFRAYADWLAVDLGFQGFAAELAGLPGRYVAPRGGLWLARRGARALGVVALRPFDAEVAELKRLYVVPEARGLALGWALSERALDRARRAGYRAVVLDTFPDRMAGAVALYERMGFAPCEPYYDNPLSGVRYYRLVLDDAACAGSAPVRRA